MLALVGKGMSRQQAYELTQRNAMKAWQNRTPFIDLLKSDRDVMALLTEKDLKAIFDYQRFLKHIDKIFVRLGLTGKKRRPSNKK
jgi:adenylosuccinate lyase